MIQELLGGSGAGLIGGERKISISSVLDGSPSHSPSSSNNTTTTTPTSSSTSENLRCPRCDSSNTKFCYYNNYNLTQPRHFCKTCRRYWTKGGALRNVPIGGGCRKNKGPGITTSLGKPIVSGNIKPVTSSDIGKIGGGYDHHDLPTNPILWASPQSTSHLLALLRSTQNHPNPNPNHNFMVNSFVVKEEGVMIGSNHMSSDQSSVTRTLGLDSFSHQVPSSGHCSSFLRNNQYQTQQNLQQMQQNGNFVLGEVQNTGISEMFQRLRSSSANYYPAEHSPVILGNVGSSSSSSSSTVLESAPVGGGEMGYWNPSLSWSDLPANNGAYH